MRIGVDVDGVLADFNRSFIQRCVTVTGRDLFPPRPFDITTWNYPESYGYTSKETSAVWESIKADSMFWRSLYPYNTTRDALIYLSGRIAAHGDDVYFITARPGIAAKQQTEMWLAARLPFLNPPIPTVLISSHKGLCAQALGLDVYIDDRWENVLDTVGVHWRNEAPKCKTFLMDRPWNREYNADLHNISRVSSVVGICDPSVADFVATPGSAIR